MAMAIYRLVALLADLNTLSCVNSQVYQAWGVVMAKITFHITPFLTTVVLATHKKGASRPATGWDTP